MAQPSELTLEQLLTSELSRALRDEPWQTIEDEAMGSVQFRARELEIARGKLILSQICQPGNLGAWQNTVQLDTDEEKDSHTWFRDRVVSIDRPLELQTLMDELIDLTMAEDETI